MGVAKKQKSKKAARVRLEPKSRCEAALIEGTEAYPITNKIVTAKLDKNLCMYYGILNAIRDPRKRWAFMAEDPEPGRGFESMLERFWSKDGEDKEGLTKFQTRIKDYGYNPRDMRLYLTLLQDEGFIKKWEWESMETKQYTKKEGRKVVPVCDRDGSSINRLYEDSKEMIYLFYGTTVVSLHKFDFTKQLKKKKKLWEKAAGGKLCKSAYRGKAAKLYFSWRGRKEMMPEDAEEGHNDHGVAVSRYTEIVNGKAETRLSFLDNGLKNVYPYTLELMSTRIMYPRKVSRFSITLPHK